METPPIAVVLVGAKGDANIGAAARAMKNFGLADLRLVRCCRHLTTSAFMYAVDARDVLERARRFATLDAALADCAHAVAFTRRVGKLRRCRMEVADLPAWVADRGGAGGVALVFGREDAGLTSDEVRRCDAICRIPSSGALPSLNLAQAVLVAGYELFGARAAPKRRRTKGAEPVAEEAFVSRRELSRAMKRLDAALDALAYEDTATAPLKRKILHQIERIFGRAGLTPRDVGMVEGLAARIRTVAGKSNAPA